MTAQLMNELVYNFIRRCCKILIHNLRLVIGVGYFFFTVFRIILKQKEKIILKHLFHVLTTQTNWHTLVPNSVTLPTTLPQTLHTHYNFTIISKWTILLYSVLNLPSSVRRPRQCVLLLRLLRLRRRTRRRRSRRARPSHHLRVPIVRRFVVKRSLRATPVEFSAASRQVSVFHTRPVNRNLFPQQYFLPPLAATRCRILERIAQSLIQNESKILEANKMDMEVSRERRDLGAKPRFIVFQTSKTQADYTATLSETNKARLKLTKIKLSVLAEGIKAIASG
jgi:hypothetical protein